MASVEIQKMTPMRVFVPSGSHKFSQIFLFLSKSTSKITEFLRTLCNCMLISFFHYSYKDLALFWQEFYILFLRDVPTHDYLLGSKEYY